MLAQGIISALTVLTLHTGDQRHSGNTVARLHMRDALSDFFNNSGEFMTQNHRIKMTCISVDTGYVGSADSGIFHLYDHTARTYDRFFGLFISNVILGMHNACHHFFCHVIRSFSVLFHKSP